MVSFVLKFFIRAELSFNAGLNRAFYGNVILCLSPPFFLNVFIVNSQLDFLFYRRKKYVLFRGTLYALQKKRKTGSDFVFLFI